MLRPVAALPAHVAVEAYSVLTRLPSGLAVSPRVAAEVLARRFPDPALRIPDTDRGVLLETLAAADVFGGATYDGLVALEALAHERMLLSLDVRAAETYRRLGAPFRLVGAGPLGP